MSSTEQIRAWVQEAGGRQKIADRLGVDPSNISHYQRRGWLPPAWYLVLKDVDPKPSESWFGFTTVQRAS